MKAIELTTITSAIANTKQVTEMAEEALRNAVSTILGKYFKYNGIVYFVRGINTNNSNLLVEYVFNGYDNKRTTYVERIIDISIAEFFKQEMLLTTPNEYLMSKRIKYSNIDTYYGVECINVEFENFFRTHDINDYILV